MKQFSLFGFFLCLICFFTFSNASSGVVNFRAGGPVVSEFEYEEIPSSFMSNLETETFNVQLLNSDYVERYVLIEGEATLMKVNGSFIKLKNTYSNKNGNRVKIIYSNSRYQVVIIGNRANDKLTGTMTVTDQSTKKSSSLAITAADVWGSEY